MADALTMWASIASWFTPTVLFCVLNLMIATIFLTSNSKTHPRKPEEDHHHHHHQPSPFYRSPSLLERVRSINFNPYRSEFPNPSEPETHQIVRAPSLLERVRSINFNPYRSDFSDPSEPETHQTAPLVRAPSLLERVRSINFNPYRSELPNPEQPETDQPDPAHEAEETVITPPAPTSKLDRNRPARLKKSASEKKKVAPEGFEVDRRGPMTVRERKPKPMSGGDEAVDEKADDFINRFKNQLKLQRLDSFVRYKEMLQRGASR